MTLIPIIFMDRVNRMYYSVFKCNLSLLLIEFFKYINILYVFNIQIYNIYQQIVTIS